MNRRTCALVLAASLSLPVFAQQQRVMSPEAVAIQEQESLSQAQLTLQAAEQAGAQNYAPTLYAEASSKLTFAAQNWNSTKKELKEQARLRAFEGLWAARATLAKSRWIGTNEAIRSLQTDITRFGGRSDVALTEEPRSLALNRGATSRDRVAFAQRVLDEAKAAGAAQVAPDDMKDAQDRLESARKIVKASANNASADFLAYTAEMMARRAFYQTRANESNRALPPLQLERTRLAQAASERQAAAERAQREEAQRQATALQQQLAQEQANRQAQAAELDRLRQQVEENRRAIQSRLDEDRSARTQAERNLDEAVARYQAALATGSATEVETLRRQVEDQQLALRTLQERERLNEQSMTSEIDRLRADLQASQQRGSIDAQVLAQRQEEINRRQQEIEQLRKDREAEYTRRVELDKQQQQAIAQAQQRRQEAEAQAAALQQQVSAAQQVAQQATQAAQAAQQQTQATQAELDRTRQELARKDAEARWLRTQQELARLASTRTESRGFIVTLPGIFFDTGKSVLKAGAKNTLAKIAAQLKGDSAMKIAVEGHTDSVGSEESNRSLSEKRAQAVRDYLVESGVSAGQITSAGKGEAEPIATNKTAAGRQQNRRVELVITNG